MFINGRPISWMAYIMFIALASAALLGVGQEGGLSSVTFPAMTGTVGICPKFGGFRRCSSFIDFLLDFHALKNVACVLVGTPPQRPKPCR